MFYLPGCLFPAEWKGKRRREKGAEAELSAAGTRSLCARPAGGGSGADPRAQPAPGPPPPLLAPSRGPLRPLPPGPASPPLPYPHLPAALSLYAPVRLPVAWPGRTPLGTRRLLPVLRLRHQPPRGPSQVPAPSSPGRCTGSQSAGRGCCLGQRHRPRARPFPQTRGRAAGLGARPGPDCWGPGAGHAEAAPAGGEGHPRTWTHLACGPAARKVSQGFTGSLPGRRLDAQALPKAPRRPRASRRAAPKQSPLSGREPLHVVQPILLFALAPNFLEAETELDSEIAWVLTLVPPLPQDKPWSGLCTSVSPFVMVI